MKKTYIWQELTEYVSSQIDASDSEIKRIKSKLDVDFLLHARFQLEDYMKQLHYNKICNDFLLFIGNDITKENIVYYLKNLENCFRFSSSSSQIDTLSQINQFKAIKMFIKAIENRIK